MAALKFRILLDSIKDEEIFRDILIDDYSNFEDFYRTVIESFELSQDQMASFYVSDDEWDKGEELSLVDLSFDEYESDEAPLEMRNVLLKDRIYDLNQRFILVHDFLSMWIFLIELHEVIQQNIQEPQLVLAIGSIPDKLKKSGPHSQDSFRFEEDLTDDFNDDFGNGFDDDFYENPDEFDY